MGFLVLFIINVNILHHYSFVSLFFLYFFQVDESVFCAGQIALVPCTMQMVNAGTRTQTLLSFSHVEKVLDAVISGLTLAHVIQAHCYTTKRQDIPIVRAIWESMLMAAVEEKVSQCGLRILLMYYTPVDKEKGHVWLLYYRCRGNIDHTYIMILHPHRMNT